MFLKPHRRVKNDVVYEYWTLEESVRTALGPRHRTVATLGKLPGLEEETRVGWEHIGEILDGHSHQFDLLRQEPAPPAWARVDTSRMRVERLRKFGEVYLGLALWRRLKLDAFFTTTMESGREEVPWSTMVCILALARFCAPSSELQIAEFWYGKTALDDLLHVPVDKVNEDRLYRALDVLLPHRDGLFQHFQQVYGELFGTTFDILLYDVTSTYFEGQAKGNAQAKHGYSRDKCSDCVQVCIALVITPEGLPLAYEVFEGNRTDVTTVEEIVEVMRDKYGHERRTWVMDRGMVSEDHIEFLQQHGRRYLVGTPKSALKRFEHELLSHDWETVREGLEVKKCPSPDGQETFILCRSADRREKEKAMHERFAQRIREGLEKIAKACVRKKQDPLTIAQRVGRLKGLNGRAAGLFHVKIDTRPDGGACVTWREADDWRVWSELSEGCYLLRSNVADWSAEDLWRTYIQLTEAEAAFRIHKSDLRIRPIWHQKPERVQAHILVCFLAYVLWKTLAQRCRQAGLGDEPRKVFAELKQIGLVDVVLPTKNGIDIRKRCVTQPTEHQAILLQRLGFQLPQRLEIHKM